MSTELADGYHGVASGKLAAVVTSLAMAAPPAVRPAAMPAGVIIERRLDPDVAWYRDLYSRVGTPWLWTSRLKLTSAALEAIIQHRDVEIFALRIEGRAEGLLELDFRVPGQCELAFFGLTPARVGQGIGRLLMARAIAQAWARPITRFWVHTCTLDHPAALAFYMHSGFVPFQRQVEIFDDPRGLGLLPPETAPTVPRL
jgi:GNAT superfamily N-acetyltransferase